MWRRNSSRLTNLGVKAVGRKKIEVEDELGFEEPAAETPDEAETDVEVVLGEECHCDHTTKASGFCPHGNNV
jgi:hypothetical protein